MLLVECITHHPITNTPTHRGRGSRKWKLCFVLIYYVPSKKIISKNRVHPYYINVPKSYMWLLKCKYINVPKTCMWLLDCSVFDVFYPDG